ncbi:MAG: hypothetical protein ACJAS1_001605 [Oleiphilaceae bacterium]
MHTLSGCKRPLARVKQLQTLMKNTKVRWLHEPVPVNPKNPHGEWSFGLDYSGCTNEEVCEFQESWDRFEKPIVESFRKPTLLQLTRRFLRKK